MGTKTASVEEKRKKLPAATLVKRAERKTPGRPSEARLRRVRERLERSPFVDDED